MKTLFIGYPKCSTCRKAYKTLQDLGIEAEYRNIQTDRPTKEELQSWIDAGISPDRLFNTSGKLYRELNLKEKRKTMSAEEVVELLSTDGMLVKRPIVLQGDTILVGNQIDAYESLKRE